MRSVDKAKKESDLNVFDAHMKEGVVHDENDVHWHNLLYAKTMLIE